MRVTSAVLIILAVGLGMVLSSCTRDDNAVATGQSQAPQWIVPIAPAPSDGVSAVKQPKKRSVSQVIDWETGGSLATDIYRLDVPPGALTYDAEYSITPNPGNWVKVDLGPEGAVFATPVTLTLDLSGTTAAGQPDITLYWYDETAVTWRDVGGVWDVSTSTLTVELEHFSTYAPGRAGW